MLDAVARLLLLFGVVTSPGSRVVVDLEPPRGKPDGTSTLVIFNILRRPVGEQLVFAGAPPAIPVRVRRRTSGWVVAAELERKVPVAAGRLSILHIGRTKLLVALEPESSLTVRYDDCANYALEGLTSYGDYCEREEIPCRSGYTESTETASPDDADCSKLTPKPTEQRDLHYCVRVGAFRVRATPGTRFEISREMEDHPTAYVVPPSGVTPYYPGVYQRCERHAVVTSSDSAVIAVGSDERFTVDIAPDGRIVGGVDEK